MNVGGALVGAGAALVVLTVVFSVAVPERAAESATGWSVVEHAPRVVASAQSVEPALAVPVDVVSEPEPIADADVVLRELALPLRPVADSAPVAELPQPAVRLGARVAHGGTLGALVRAAPVGASKPGEFVVALEHARESDVAFVGLPPSSTRLEGRLLERADGAVHLRGWFELPAGASEVTLSLPGRFVVVELQGDEVGMLSIDAGPRPGWRPEPHDVGAIKSGEGRRVWIPHQAAAVAVTAPDGRRTRAVLTAADTSASLRLPGRAR